MASPIRSYIDPACPWAWVTNNWLFTQVAPQRALDITMAPFSLAIINEGNDSIDEDKRVRFTATKRLLRLYLAVDKQVGNEAMVRLYFAIGKLMHNPDEDARITADNLDIDAILAELDLPASLASELENDTWDAKLVEWVEEAKQAAGGDIGTPIISQQREDGSWVAYFGPVLSRMPKGDAALQLWDGLTLLMGVPGFFELKRSRNEDLDLSSVL